MVPDVFENTIILIRFQKYPRPHGDAEPHENAYNSAIQLLACVDYLVAIVRRQLSLYILSLQSLIHTLGGRWALLIAHGSTTTLPFGAFCDSVTFSSSEEMPALVVGLSL